MADRGYVYLLTHLHRPTTTLPLSTVQASISHYLAHLQPSPTSLSATLVSSPLFRPFSHAKLDALSTALRHALHIRVKLFKGEDASIFVRGLGARTADWVRAVLEGVRGGHPVTRLVCAGGLLLGLEDLEEELHARERRIRREVEEEIILALAEVIDLYACKQSSAGWEKDFEGVSQNDEEPLSLALVLSSVFVPLVSTPRLQALPLPILADLLASTIESAFHNGAFLSELPGPFEREGHDKVTFSPKPYAQDVQALISSHSLTSMASLARFCAQVLSVLAESRPLRGWPVMAHGMWRLESLAQKIEVQWVKSPLASISDDSAIAPDARELTTTLWAIFKTLLFTSIMISQAVLSSVVFIPHPSTTLPSTEILTPYSLAVTVLRTLFHLAFVIHQFGGVTSTSEGGFVELRRAFYMALDVLSASPHESEQFVADLCDSFKSEELLGAPSSFVYTKRAYALACIEQLVPVLSDGRTRTDVFELCVPHLSDPSHRETYESAHSVMLAVFASHAHRTGVDGQRVEPGAPAFAEVLVPFYSQCLLENSGDDRLSTAQLRLAYAALVRSASALGQKRTAHGGSHPPGDTVAWFCVEKLLDAIRRASKERPATESQLHRLHLTLLATLPGLSLSLLPWVLDEVKTAVVGARRVSSTSGDASQDEERRIELVQALFKELAENVGDGEKEFVMRWWYDNREVIAGTDDQRLVSVTLSEEKTALVSRL
ncbi:hypothetical protein B0H21DRAFT_826484 [Amylocystis lapponica]|nr:hypothetical protein B0H21DRAFT_826484 [Amylocystis lapponica]